MDETKYKLDREAKIKDMVDGLKSHVAALVSSHPIHLIFLLIIQEKGMALDIETAVKSHDQTNYEIKSLSDKIKELQQERQRFMTAQDKIRGQVKDFEVHLSEVRGVQDRQFLDLKSDLTKRLEAACSEFDEMKIDRRQLKAMVRNQNHQFTEMQKEIGVCKARLTAVEKTASEVPGLLQYTEINDNYLQNFLPTEVYAEIHRCMQATLESAPTKMRLDQIEYSHRRMMEALEKIKQMGTLTQETFIKTEFVPLKLDFDAYSIRTQYEDEEKERVEKERSERAAALTRKTSGQLFRDKMFNADNLDKMALYMEKRMLKSNKKLIGNEMKNDPWMIKLIDFYQDEMGSADSDIDNDDSDGSSQSGSSSSSGSSANSLSSVQSVTNILGKV